MSARHPTKPSQLGSSATLLAAVALAVVGSLPGCLAADDEVCFRHSDCSGSRSCVNGKCQVPVLAAADGALGDAVASGDAQSDAAVDTSTEADAKSDTKSDADASDGLSDGKSDGGDAMQDSNGDADGDGSGGTGGGAGSAGAAGAGGSAGQAGSAGVGGSAGIGGASGSAGAAGSAGSAGAAGSAGLCQVSGPDGLYCEVKPGKFQMGSPPGELGQDINEQKHEVTLTRGYWVLSTEVTQGTWTTVMGSNPSAYQQCGNECPVESFTWFMAVVYTNRLSTSAGFEACYTDPDDSTAYDEADATAEKTPLWPKGLDCAGYRLPTEAEWEYAARAGTTSAFYTGAIAQGDCTPLDPNMDVAGWYCGNTDPYTHAGKGKQPNAWGLYDVYGNVSEWVWDAYADYPAGPVIDPLGGDQYSRIMRGGNFYNNPVPCRSAARFLNYPVAGMEAIGLRTARTVPNP